VVSVSRKLEVDYTFEPAVSYERVLVALVKISLIPLSPTPLLLPRCGLCPFPFLLCTVSITDFIIADIRCIVEKPFGRGNYDMEYFRLLRIITRSSSFSWTEYRAASREGMIYFRQNYYLFFPNCLPHPVRFRSLQIFSRTSERTGGI